MHIMLEFKSPFQVILEKILTSLFSNAYIGGYFSFDSDSEFVDIIHKYTNQKTIIRTTPINNNFPQIYSPSFATQVDTYNLSGGASEVRTQFGKQIALLKARGEFLERLSSFFPTDALQKNKASLAHIAKTFPKFLSAKKLFSFGYKKIESSYVYYSFSRLLNVGQLPKYQATTNGGAGHFVYEKAVLGGLLELIQRDAFLVHWLNSISPKKIDVDSFLLNQKSISEEFLGLRQLVNDFKKYKIDYCFLDITSDIAVPSVCCVATTKENGVRMALGASAGFNPERNLLSAATEACSVIRSVSTKTPVRIDKKTYVPFKDSTLGREKRLSLYTSETMCEEVHFFTASKETVSVSSWAGVQGSIEQNGFSSATLRDDTRLSLAYLKKIFNERKKTNSGYEVLVYEIKNKLLSHYNYKVVRVFCDALYSLYLNEHYADPNHPRLKEFAKNKNLEKEAKLNIWPHPFP